MLHWRVVTPLIIAIDGPSGAGKGTLARAVADRLMYRHIDTGAMYRAVAWKAIRDGIALDDEAAVAALATEAVLAQDGGRITIDGHDVTRAIRTSDMDKAAARVAKLPRVREVLVDRQRRDAREGGVVMEGRDIGTVVFPAADVKVYLDASPEERARRRAGDAAHTGGKDGTVAAVATDLEERDRTDSTRAVAPLAMAADAVYIDTTRLAIEDVVARVLRLVEEAGGSGEV
jgi:cytidylate kinase